MTKYPRSSVFASRANRVPISVAVTLAETTALREGSVTVPPMVPKPCAYEKRGVIQSAKNAIGIFFFISPFPSASWPKAVQGHGARRGGAGHLDQSRCIFRKQSPCGTQPQLGAIRSLEYSLSVS